MNKKKKRSASQSKSNMRTIMLQLAMCLVAAVIGLALYFEQQFSPILALGATALAYIAFRAVHNLLDTAHKVNRLGRELAITQPRETEPAKETQVPASGNENPKAVLEAIGDDEITANAILSSDPVAMEKLQPSGDMASDLIAEALMQGLSDADEAARTDANLDDDLELAAVNPGEAGQSEVLASREMIDQIAEELSSMRPGYEHLSVEGLTRDLEAATQALEDELRESLESGADREVTSWATDDLPDAEPVTEEMSDAPLPDVISSLQLDEAAPQLDEAVSDQEIERAYSANADAKLDNPENPEEPEAQNGVEADADPAEETDAIAEEQVDGPADDEAELSTLVKAAISSSRAMIYLQPILGLATRKAESFEVLTHLEGEDGRILGPSQFMDEAERSGQMPQIDNVMFERTFDVLRNLVATSSPGTMFCNLSIYSLSDEELMDNLMVRLKSETQSAARLVIELSEEAYLACTTADRDRLEAMRDLGVRLSIDRITDTGIFMDTLKSGLFDFIKIDACFFLDRLGSGDDALMPAELLSEATLAGVDLIVEKIESQEDLERAIEFGAKYGQGYVFSEPRPVKRELLEDAA